MYIIINTKYTDYSVFLSHFIFLTAENTILGHIQKGGAAATMQSAAMRNERAGLVDHNDMSYDAGLGCVSIIETDLPGKRVITESIGDSGGARNLG